MKLISWNVNGFRSVMSKKFLDSYQKLDADIFSLQETKMQEDQLTDEMKVIAPYEYWNSAKRKGYSGTATFSKIEPINVTFDLSDEMKNKLLAIMKKDTLLLSETFEGRLITLEFENFFLVNCYTPNSKRELERLEFRKEWEDEIRNYLIELDKIKPIIYCGDLNVAHEEIDLKNPSSNHNNAGFTDDERNKMTELLNANFIDTFRYKYPTKANEYSWWSYMFHARENNAGWRIDYFIVSDRIKDKIIDAKIHQEIMGSDHCPVELEIDL